MMYAPHKAVSQYAYAETVLGGYVMSLYIDNNGTIIDEGEWIWKEKVANRRPTPAFTWADENHENLHSRQLWL
jgi:hypothetical protein